MAIMKSIATIVLVAGLSQAAPSAYPRDITLLSLCNDPDLVDCLDFQTDFEVCAEIPGEFDNNIESLDTFSDSKFCTFYHEPNCGQGATITLSGVQTSLPDDEKNLFSSLICHRP
ncbi:hypothetical protein BJ170DRAFT_683199 [Xylariales sp. AK1849]|nr:hypothetical protein BJ170DRAFT_683199 [Xylariales sp. AK1849]